MNLGDAAGPIALTTLDGQPLTMSHCAATRATAILFLSARSPDTEAAVPTLNELNRRFRLREVLFVGVFPNPAEDAVEIRQFAQRRGFMFPVYRDPAQQSAARFGARAMPEAALLDAAGQLRYRGAVGGTNDSPGLGQALAALLAGEPIAIPSVPAVGSPIAEPAPPRDVPDPFGAPAFSSGLIFECLPDVPAHHCSTLAEAANGDLVAVWYGGSFESADDQVLFLARRRKGERVWAQPEALIRNSIQPPGNAVVFRDGRDRLWIVWCRMEAPRPLRRGGGWGQTRLWYRTSEDHGVTWSEDRPFLGGLGEGLRNVPITLANGALLLPLGRSFALTGDQGRTWEQVGAVARGGQPTVVERADGSLLTLLRQGPRILQTESRDGGRTWSPTVATALPNPNAGIAMARLRNGHLVLVYNHSENARSPLNLARSLDEGRTWEAPLALESNPGEYSYPSLIQSADDRIQIVYTYRRYAIMHVELNEDWLAHLTRPN